jgi:hypothetical protein
MRQATKDALTAKAARLYAHRLAVDPDNCPCCCGDGSTDDSRFGTIILYVIDEDTHNERPIFRCFCRAIPEDV